MIVHARDRKTCDDTAFGVYVDGKEKGKHIKVCTNSKCAVHGYAAAQAHGSAQDKEKRAKAKVEALTRMCIFQAIFQASSQFQLQDEDYLKVVEFAIWRAGHNDLMRTAKVVGWNKDLTRYYCAATLSRQPGGVSNRFSSCLGSSIQTTEIHGRRAGIEQSSE